MSLVIVGAGPNLGLAVARRVGREGFSVGLISRTGGRIAPGGDHEPADVADVLWSHHAERGPFETGIGPA